AWLVVVVGVLLAMVAIGVVGEAERDPQPTDTLAAGYDSTRGVDLQQLLPSEDTAAAVVLFTAEDAIGPRLPALEALVGGIDTGVPGPPAFVQPAEDGTAALSVLNVPAETATEVAESVTDLRTQLREGAPDGVEAQVTGPAAIR